MPFADDQKALIKELIEAARAHVHGDTRIDALWLAGSLGRDEGDRLSDIDLLLIAAPGSTKDLVESLADVIGKVGPVAFVHSAPQNAPVDGAHWNVLYDTHPLPVYVDWNIWPPVERRPNDVNLLLESRSFDQSKETISSMQNEFANLQGLGQATEPINRFRVMMIPVLAKKAARGEFDSVKAMLGYMKLPAHPISSLEAAVEFGRSILAEYGGSESEVAIATIERYLTTIGEPR